MVIPKLAFSNLLASRVRAALTVAAIALSVSLVVAVTSGYASLESAAYKFFNQYLGSTDATITPQNYGSAVPESLTAAVRRDSRVRQAVGRLETDNRLLVEKQDELEPSRMAEVSGISRPDDTQVNNMNIEAGGWFNSDDGDVVVIDQAVADLLHVKVGGQIELPGIGDKRLKLTVVGIVHKPDVMARARPSLYLPLHTLQRFKGFVGQINRISIEFRAGTNPEQFKRDWAPRLEKIDPGLRMKLAGERQQILGDNLQALHLVSYMGGLVSMVAAMFIVFSALSMGVTERQRTLAMLRAVGAFRRQVAALVVFEGILLAGLGVAIGVPLGWAWISLLAWWFNRLFYAGAVLSWGGAAFGAGGSFLAAIAASLLPAWSAARVKPMEAMAPLSAPTTHRPPFGWAAAGLLLISIDPILMFGPVQWVAGRLFATSPHDAVRLIKLIGHFALGLPALMIGFFLLSPLFVWTGERVLAPLVARLLGLKYALLRQQFSSGLWRAAGTCTALMVGLAVLIVLQTEGRTALSGWKLPNKFPDIFIVDWTGISLADAAKLQEVHGIRSGRVMPIAIVSPGLPPGFLSMAGLMVMPDRTMFIGIDPNIGFELMELDFREGNVRDAERLLKLGHHVLVTTEFQQLKGLGLGGKLPLKTNHGVVEYTIAGVVWSPGIDVIVSAFDMGRQMDQRTAASVFGTIEDAQRDFGVQKFNLFAADLDYGVQKENVLKAVQKALKLQGMAAGDVRQIKYNIEQTFYRLLLLVSTVAFAAMAVASLGVTNTIMASIRSRRWQFGILRSIGVTRGQLLRLVLAEALLLGLIGCALGVPAGMEMGVNAEALQVAITGYKPPLHFPWHYVLLGSGIVVGISLLASLWPAILVARSEPLELLQAGRAAT